MSENRELVHPGAAADAGEAKVPDALSPREGVGAEMSYLIKGPALISFSGGRTSAYMLHEILKAHGGTLPNDVVVAFANTGKEREETLRFVHECASRWGVYVHWVEWRPKKTDREPHWEAWAAVLVMRRLRQAWEIGELVDVKAISAAAESVIAPVEEWWRDAAARCGNAGYELVSPNSASRAGEPFAGLIAAKGFLPNRGAGYCSIELKGRTIRNFLQKERGWKRWSSVIGLRADEQDRVMAVKDRNRKGGDCWRSVMPLNEAGVTRKGHIRPFWAAQDFDLGLWDYEGNCDFCWKKHDRKLLRIMRDGRSAEWWLNQEAISPSADPNGRRFILDYTFADLAQRVANEPEFGLSEMEVDDHDAECGLWCPVEAA